MKRTCPTCRQPAKGEYCDVNVETNFSFEVYYTELSASSESQRDRFMRDLEPTVQALLAANDSGAKVSVGVSDSHKGSGHKIMEVTTTMAEAQMYGVIRQFCDTNGVTITALE